MPEASLIEFLKSPEAYPERPSSVHLIQTHISWVFVGDEFVYKLKKPLDLGFLDFTTLERRRHYILEELRLNSRFSPEIYLAVVPISDVKGRYVLGDDSHVVEYALKMKKIDEDVMLSRLLAAGRLHEKDLDLVGRRLAEIYSRIGSEEKVRYFGTVPVISFNIRENFEETRKYIGGPVDEKTFRAIESWSTNFIHENTALFEERIESGHIRDCHGDLHLEHVCLQNGRVLVFDCIEFNERFRYGDVASDAAFLSMDFDFNSRSDLGDAFVHAFIEASGDAAMGEILPFYKVYRAYVRAKVASFMLDSPGIGEDMKKSVYRRAQKYYNLAYRYIIA